MGHPSIAVSPLYPLAQACIESANFTSSVFDRYNNCLGMKAPNKRETTCTNKGQGGYANYESVMDGIEDYILWLKEFGLTDDEKLLAHLKAGRYAEDKQYYSKVINMVASLKAEGAYIDYAKVVTLAGGTVLGVGAAGYLAYDKFIKS